MSSAIPGEVNRVFSSAPFIADLGIRLESAGAAAASLVRNGQFVLSTEFKINLLRVAKGERLVCRAKVLKAGAQLIVAESEVFCVASGEERLVSKATVTLAVVSPRPGSRVPPSR